MAVQKTIKDSFGNTVTKELQFPITGFFSSKRGVGWSYTIYRDLSVEQYHSTTKRKRNGGGWSQGPDVFAPKCTNELKQHIKEKYGLDVKT